MYDPQGFGTLFWSVNRGAIAESLIQHPLEIAGGPNWIDRDRYDITAKAECDGGKIRQDQIPLMLQSVLEDRFQLKSHFETRELPVYALVIAKSDIKIKASEDQSSPPPLGAPPEPCKAITEPAPGQGGRPFPTLPNPGSPTPRGAIMTAMNPQHEMTISGASVPIANLMNVLEGQAGRHIVDRTDLKGLFDFKIQFSANGFSPTGPGFGPAVPAPSPTVPDPGVSLFTALEEQLGLKLEPARGPVEVLVIDQVEKPSAN